MVIDAELVGTRPQVRVHGPPVRILDERVKSKYIRRLIALRADEIATGRPGGKSRAKIDRTKVQVRTTLHHRRQILLGNDGVESSRYVHHGSLRNLQSQIIGQLRRDQFGDLRLRIHLLATKFYHHFKRVAARVFTAQQQRMIPSGGHWLCELRGGEFEDFHVNKLKIQLRIYCWRPFCFQRVNVSELPRITHLDNRESKLLQPRHERLTVSEPRSCLEDM